MALFEKGLKGDVKRHLMPETAIAVCIVENKSVQTSKIRMKAGFRLGAFAVSNATKINASVCLLPSKISYCMVAREVIA